MGKNAEYIFSFIELHMYNYKKKNSQFENEKGVN